MNEIYDKNIVSVMSKQMARQTDNVIYGFIEDIATEYGIKRYIHADKETIANALMEYPKYKELGTVEELSDMKQNYFEALSDWRQYRKIGTLEECRQAVERMKPKKPINISRARPEFVELLGICPNCRGIVSSAMLTCRKCFQVLDWGNLEGNDSDGYQQNE